MNRPKEKIFLTSNIQCSIHFSWLICHKNWNSGFSTERKLRIHLSFSIWSLFDERNPLYQSMEPLIDQEFLEKVDCILLWMVPITRRANQDWSDTVKKDFEYMGGPAIFGWSKKKWLLLLLSDLTTWRHLALI